MRLGLRYAWLLLLIGFFSGFAQQSPFLPEDTYNKLVNEISGDIAYDNLRSLVMYHAPTGGAEDFQREAQWVLERAKSYGLEEAKYISLPAFGTSADSPGQNWTLKGGELWLLEPQLLKLGDVQESPLFVADNSPTVDLTADLIDVGEGTEESDYAGKEVAGKIVLAYGAINKVREKACWQGGAVGIVSYFSSRANPWTDYPNQLAWAHVGVSKKDEKPAPPVFMVTPRNGLMLSRWIAGRPLLDQFAGEPPSSAPGRFRVRLKIQAEVTQPGRQGMVEGFIRGTTYHAQAIVLTAHMQEEKTSANDDRSGCASLLEIARALTAMIADGRLPRPQRDLRFWWTNEINAEFQYFAQNPEARQRIIADINQDMVGAKQSLGGRSQHVSRTPYSRWSFLNDVVGNILTSFVQGNNSYLPAVQNHNPAPYSRPIFSRFGSREPYRAEMVPYFDSSDHMVFNNAVIGIPAVTFTNWPDPYIHSSDDDLWQVDQTQLQRNAVAVAAIALYLANLGNDDVPTLAAVVSGAAQQRIARDFEVGVSRLTSAPAAERLQAYQDAQNLIQQAVAREKTGLESLSKFAGESNRKLITNLETQLAATEKQDRERLDQWAATLSVRMAPTMEERERAAAHKVPRKFGTLGEYLERADDIKGPKTLHSLMQEEALNYVDGKRSILDIYRAVRAESLSAGEWYYGKVSLKDIEEFLEAAARAKVIEIVTKTPSGDAARRVQAGLSVF
jgi:hypothetical protein